jgi:hypothetical protein
MFTPPYFKHVMISKELIQDSWTQRMNQPIHLFSTECQVFFRLAMQRLPREPKMIHTAHNANINALWNALIHYGFNTTFGPSSYLNANLFLRFVLKNNSHC